MGNDPLKPPPIIRQSEGAGKEDATARILIFSYFHKLFSYFGGCNSNAVDIVGEIRCLPIFKRLEFAKRSSCPFSKKPLNGGEWKDSASGEKLAVKNSFLSLKFAIQCFF